MTLAINFVSEMESDAAFEELSAKGAEGSSKLPKKYSGAATAGMWPIRRITYWELAYNPFVSLDDRRDMAK